MTSNVPAGSDFYIGFINDEPVAFVSMTPLPHPTNKNIIKSSRIVCLPHWQGYGIGMKMSDYICGMDKYSDKCVHATTTLPIRQKYLEKSDKWVIISQGARKPNDKTKLTKYNRSDVYLETYKFLNNGITKKDIKPMYRVLEPFGIAKKDNSAKLHLINEILNKKEA